MDDQGMIPAAEVPHEQADSEVSPETQQGPASPPEEELTSEAVGSRRPAEGASWAAEAQRIIEEIVDRMGLRATAVVREETESQIVLDLQGEDIARLIGRQGETLNALQLLLSVVLNKRRGANKRILVDAENYRYRREAALQKRAQEVARQVKATGKEALLDSLKPYERRIIHMALADDPDVTTYSEGEGHNRCLVISPRE